VPVYPVDKPSVFCVKPVYKAVDKNLYG